MTNETLQEGGEPPVAASTTNEDGDHQRGTTTASSTPISTNKEKMEDLELNANDLLQRPPPTASPATSIQEATIEKILRFWNHPSLQHVSPAQKQEYLEQKGISKEQMFQAWDRLVASSTENGAANHTGSSNASAINPLQPQPQPQPQQVQPQTPNQAISPYNNNYVSHSNAASSHRPNYSYDDYYNNQHPPAAEDPAVFATDDVGASQMAMVATVGGFLGLFAAAAVRWLNGGDFVLFPSPSRSQQVDERTTNAGRVMRLQSNINASDDNAMEDVPTIEEEEEGEEDSNDENSKEEDEEEDTTDADLARYLSPDRANANTNARTPDVLQQVLTQFTAFSEAMQQQVILQQRMLQKLNSASSTSGPNVTDKSMQVLRRSNTNGSSSEEKEEVIQAVPATNPANLMMWYKLVEIHAELSCLKRDLGVAESNDTDDQTIRKSRNVTKEVEARLQDTLQRLNTVLEDFQSTAIEKKKEKDGKSSCSNEGKEEKSQVGTASGSPAATASTEESTSAEDDDKRPVSPQRDTEEMGNGNQTPPLQSTVVGTDKDASNNDSGTDSSDPPHLNLRQAVINLIRENTDDPAMLKTGAQIMFLYVNNLTKNPHVPRYRKVFTSNESFQKVDKLKGARAFLFSLGFVPKNNNKLLEWPPPPQEQTNDNEDNNPLSSQDKDALVKAYHLPEAADALKVIKAIKPNENSEETTLELLEKVLEILPFPTADSSPILDAPSDPQGAEKEEIAIKKTYAEMATNNQGKTASPIATMEKESKEEEETNAIWK